MYACVGCGESVTGNALLNRCDKCQKDYKSTVNNYMRLMETLNPKPVRDKTKCSRGHERALYAYKGGGCKKCHEIRVARKALGNGSIWY